MDRNAESGDWQMGLVKLSRRNFLLAASAASMSAASFVEATNGPQLVRIASFRFTPQTLTVRAGSVVTWINDDSTPHNVVANNRSFRSSLLDTDGRYSHQFDTPGEYAYFCSLHPHMTGRVVVARS